MLNHFWRKWWPGSFHVSPTSSVRIDGFVWHLTAAGVARFGNAGPGLAEWKSAGRERIIKDGRQRTISRVELEGGAVYLKRIRPNTPRAWFREILRPSKARLEFENAVALRAAGIRCVEPLAYAETVSIWPGESRIITSDVPDALTGDIFLESISSDTPLAIRRRVARGLGAFLARMHDAGFAHPDPHPGNFLIDLPDAHVPHFTLLDVHDIHMGGPLDWRKSLENLVLLNRWFQLRASRADRQRFWKAYIDGRSTLGVLTMPATRLMAKELEFATLDSNRRFWVGRTARYLGSNRQFHRVRNGTCRGHAVRDFSAELIHLWLRDPDAVFADPSLVAAAPGLRKPCVRILKDSRTSTVARIDYTTDDATSTTTAIYKRFRMKSWTSRWKNLFRPSPALRSWLAGNHLIDRQIATARPLTLFHRRTSGTTGTGYLVVEMVQDAVDLAEAVRMPVPHAVRLNWIERLARLVRTMHDRDVSNRDLKAANILLAGATRDPASAMPVLIDLVGVVYSKPVRERTRVRDLARLNASFLNDGTVSRGERLRFLLRYLNANFGRTSDWKTWWRAIAGATDDKVRRNGRSGRPLA